MKDLFRTLLITVFLAIVCLHFAIVVGQTLGLLNLSPEPSSKKIQSFTLYETGITTEIVCFNTTQKDSFIGMMEGYCDRADGIIKRIKFNESGEVETSYIQGTCQICADPKLCIIYLENQK